jgi:tRNA threonylcarbamoyladenosine biosynthesis protein TsaE
MNSFSVQCKGLAATERVARALAPWLELGDSVILTGGLATGKTSFVKALVDACGSDDLVTSPTFMLAQFYGTQRGRVVHVDAYRLVDTDEYRDLGLEEYADDSIFLVEWGEKVATEFEGSLTIEFSVCEDGIDDRLLVLSAESERWDAVLSALSGSLVGAL